MLPETCLLVAVPVVPVPVHAKTGCPSSAPIAHRFPPEKLIRIVCGGRVKEAAPHAKAVRLQPTTRPHRPLRRSQKQ